jgi:hypothetical protein
MNCNLEASVKHLNNSAAGASKLTFWLIVLVESFDLELELGEEDEAGETTDDETAGDVEGEEELEEEPPEEAFGISGEIIASGLEGSILMPSVLAKVGSLGISTEGTNSV